MPRLAAFALCFLALTISLAACAPGVTLAEAYGEPDPFDWSYFRASPEAVIQATDQALSFSSVRIESFQDVEGGTVLTLSGRYGSAAFTEIYVEATAEEGYGARAQIYRQNAPLPDDLEVAIRAQLGT